MMTGVPHALVRCILPPAPRMTFLIVAAIGLVLVYVAAINLLYGFQQRLIYFPDPEYSTPADAELLYTPMPSAVASRYS